MECLDESRRKQNPHLKWWSKLVPELKRRQRLKYFYYDFAIHFSAMLVPPLAFICFSSLVSPPSQPLCLIVSFGLISSHTRSIPSTQNLSWEQFLFLSPSLSLSSILLRLNKVKILAFLSLSLTWTLYWQFKLANSRKNEWDKRPCNRKETEKGQFVRFHNCSPLLSSSLLSFVSFHLFIFSPFSPFNFASSSSLKAATLSQKEK